MPAREIDKLKALTDNPEHIPGIYNYCDKWCERCPFGGTVDQRFVTPVVVIGDG